MEDVNFTNNLKSNVIGEFRNENGQISFYMDDEEDEKEDLETDPLSLISPVKNQDEVKIEVDVEDGVKTNKTTTEKKEKPKLERILRKIIRKTRKDIGGTGQRPRSLKTFLQLIKEIDLIRKQTKLKFDIEDELEINPKIKDKYLNTFFLRTNFPIRNRRKFMAIQKKRARDFTMKPCHYCGFLYSNSSITKHLKKAHLNSIQKDNNSSKGQNQSFWSQNDFDYDYNGEEEKSEHYGYDRIELEEKILPNENLVNENLTKIKPELNDDDLTPLKLMENKEEEEEEEDVNFYISKRSSLSYRFNLNEEEDLNEKIIIKKSENDKYSEKETDLKIKCEKNTEKEICSKSSSKRPKFEIILKKVFNKRESERAKARRSLFKNNAILKRKKYKTTVEFIKELNLLRMKMMQDIQQGNIRDENGFKINFPEEIEIPLSTKLKYAKEFFKKDEDFNYKAFSNSRSSFFKLQRKKARNPNCAPCPICGFFYSLIKNGLKMHIEIMHSSESESNEEIFGQ